MRKLGMNQVNARSPAIPNVIPTYSNDRMKPMIPEPDATAIMSFPESMCVVVGRHPPAILVSWSI